MKPTEVMYAVRCRYCRDVPGQGEIGPILLPQAIRLRIAEDPEGSSMGTFHLIAAFPDCRLASAYSDQDVERAEIQSDKRAVRLAMLCGVDNCDTPITIHAVAHVGDTISEVLDNAKGWDFDERCICPKGGHPLEPSGVYVLEGYGLLPDGSYRLS